MEMTGSDKKGDSTKLDVAVLDADYYVLPPGEVAADAVGDGDRAVAAAGAADGDRQVALALGDVGGDEELEQRQQPAVELTGLGSLLDVLAHLGVHAGFRAQVIDVVRVGQETDVEGEVGIAWRPVLEPEGQQGEGELAGLLLSQQLFGDLAAQLSPGQVAGLDHLVGALTQRRQQLALGPNPLDDPAFRSQRVAAAGLLVAVEQGLLVGLEEEDHRPQPFGLEVVEHLQQVVEVLTAAHVGDDRGALDAAALVAEELAEAGDHPRRQVVDAEVAAVLEGGDRLRLARARVAGDDDERHLLRHRHLSWSG